MDLAKLSDAELDTLIQRKSAEAAAALSDDELDKMIQQKQDEQSGLLGYVKRGAQAALESPVGRGVVAVGRFVDRYTGAPTRAAIYEAQKSGERLVTGQGSVGEFVGSPLDAFAKQYGKDPEKAPTGKQIAEETGLKGAAATVAGIGVDVLADPTNIIPLGTIGKLGAKGVKEAGLASKAALKWSAAAAEKIGVPGAKTGQTVAQAAGGLVKDAKGYMNELFNPKRAVDADEMLAIAKKNNIDTSILPEAVEFGKESVISRAARKRNEGLLGQKYLENHKEATAQINKALETKIDSISGGGVLSPAEGGQLIRDGMDRAADKVFEQASVRYSTVLKDQNIKSITDEAANELDKVLNSVERTAMKTEKYGVGSPVKTQARDILEAIKTIKSSAGNYNILLEQMQQIGKQAFKNKHIIGQLPPDTKALRDLYFGMSEALISTAGQKGSLLVKDGQFADDVLRESNKILKEYFTDKSFIAKAANQNVAPEKLFQSVVENGDTLQAQALKNLLAPEDFNKLKGAFVNSMLKRNSEDFISFKTLNNTMNRKADVMKVIFSPEEIKDIKEIVRLGDRIDVPVLSTSGTGASNFFDFTKGVVTKAVGNRAVIDLLKKKAREAGVAEKAIEESVKKGTVGINDLIKQIGGLRRSKKEISGLKVPQVVSVQANKGKEE